jgi:2-dehydro-3-deoxyglucarate aldolase
MGRPGELDYPEVLSAIERVKEAGRHIGKPGGIHVVEPDPEQLVQNIKAGFNFLGYGLDIRILDTLCRGHMHLIREAL